MPFAALEKSDAWARNIPLDVGTLTEDQRGVLAHLWKRVRWRNMRSIAAFATFVSELLTLGALLN